MMSNLILSPSSNWFQHNGVSSRQEDRLLVTSCFRNIVSYKVSKEKGLPKVIKLIPHTPGKVCGVSIFPVCKHEEFGHTVASIGDHGTLTLFDIHNGTLLAQHKMEKSNFTSLCWGHVRGEEVVAAVGDKGRLVVWQPKYLVAKTFTLETKNKSLSVIEVLPHLRDQALVALEMTILLVSLQSGEVISQYKGHNSPIYCIRWYPGTTNPRVVEALPTNTRWKRNEDRVAEVDNNPFADEDSNEVAAGGPYFATSDFGRSIFLWDISAKRFLVSFNAPTSTGNNAPKKWGTDRPNSKLNHITLNWAGDKLYSSTVIGEVIEWNLSRPEPKYKLVTHLHSRVIYNMEVIENLVITFSQDRVVQAYDLGSSSNFFSMHTMGANAHSMAFSPHDANRLAIGMQDESIKLFTFGSDSPFKLQSIYQNVKGKVLAICWHPNEESKLLFGTSEGQVGIADMFSGKTTTFAYFHQKSVYKVEWALAVAPALTGLKEDEWYAYSFGDRDLVAHNPYNVLQDPVSLCKLMGLDKGVNGGSFHLSEFAFSPDHRLLGLGSVNGEIKIYNCSTLECCIVISRVRKVIQHLLWKPPTTSTGYPYVLAVGSGETSAYIFDLEAEVKAWESPMDPVTLTQPSKELCAHIGRVVWISWSPHSDGLIATASYDHTVQVWDSCTGEPVGNYGGHTHRVFRAEFSPIGPDKVISFAEENCIHEWRPSELTNRTPTESTVTMKEYKRRVKGFKPDCDQRTNDSKNAAAETSSTISSTIASNETSVAIPPPPPSLPPSRRSTKKSSFPLLHNVLSRKKSFHHMCLLSLIEANEAEIKLNGFENDESISEDLEDEISPANDAIKSNAVEAPGMEDHVKNALKKYKSFMPPDQPLPEVDDVRFCLDFFGSVPQIDKVVAKEIKNHENSENSARANLMRCWQGSLESHIRWAAKHKCLDAFLVSAAPQVSFSLWEYACEAYAEQLAEEEDPVTAATYLISIHKDEEAVDLLIKHKQFREALTIAKFRLGFNSEVIQKVLSTWASSTAFEGNFEICAILQYCLGNTETAARTMARRTEPRSLAIASKMYLSSGCTDLAHSTAVLAFKEASSKNEFYKFEPILSQLPNLEWCKCINICQESIWDHIKLFKKEFSDRSSRENTIEANGVCNGSLTEAVEETVLGPYLTQTICQRWKEMGIVPSTFAKYSKEIKENLATQSLPSSLKILWFLVSISLSEMLLDGGLLVEEKASENCWEECLVSMLKYICFWGKNDQTYYLTHLLLPNGIEDLSTLSVPVANTNSPVIHQLRQLYVLSEANVVLTLLQNDDTYVPWKVEETNSSSHVSTAQDVEIVTDEIEKIHLNGAEDGDPESLVKDTRSISDVNPVDNLHLFNCENDFLSSFDTYIEELSKGIVIDYPGAKDRITVLSQIISSLRGRAAIHSKLDSNLISKLEKLASVDCI